MKRISIVLLLIIIFHFANSQIITLDIEIYLEGSFNVTEMNTTLNAAGLIPLIQPYNQTPWNYTGTENVNLIPNPNIVDWVLIELRETTGNSSTAIPSTMVAQKACFINKDGEIVSIDGVDLPQFNLAISNNLYVVVHHRNHLSVMSSAQLVEIGGIYEYNFRDNLSKAYLDGQKEIYPGIFGMIAGDCDRSGVIDNNDKNEQWTVMAGESGYDFADIDLDGEIHQVDKNDFWFWNSGSESKVPVELPFSCGGQVLDYDGNTYNTIQMGTQCWMAENLITTTYSNGTTIPHVTDNSSWNSLISGAYTFYDNNISWEDKYGLLYNWYAVVDANGLCPSGWSVPTNADWTVLTDFIGGLGPDQGNTIKSCRQVNSPEPGGCNTSVHPRWDEDAQDWGTDDFGFAGLPGGFRFHTGNFNALGTSAYWWTSTEKTSTHAWLRGLGYYYGSVDVIDFYKKGGFSVRCLKD